MLWSPFDKPKQAREALIPGQTPGHRALLIFDLIYTADYELGRQKTNKNYTNQNQNNA